MEKQSSFQEIMAVSLVLSSVLGCKKDESSPVEVDDVSQPVRSVAQDVLGLGAENHRRGVPATSRRVPASSAGLGGKPVKAEVIRQRGDLERILRIYEFVLGPVSGSGFYYIDLTDDHYSSFGPFYCPHGVDKGEFHDRVRKGLIRRDSRVFVDTERDFPVPVAFGVKDQLFRRKYVRSEALHNGSKLRDLVADAFDRAYSSSKAQQFLARSGNDRYFRDLILYGLVAVESGWKTKQRTFVGKDKGGRKLFAKGLFQIMDESMQALVRRQYLREIVDPDDPEQAAQCGVALLDFHLDYLKEEVGGRSFLFRDENVKAVLIPLLLMSYNQGHGRLARMARYLTSKFEEGTIPSRYYHIDQQGPIFNEDVMLFLFSRAFSIIKTDKLDGALLSRTDEEFKSNNGGFGSDGAQYAFKVIAQARAFRMYLCRPDDKVDGQEYKIIRTDRDHPYYAQVLRLSGVDVPGWDSRLLLSPDELRRYFQGRTYREFMDPLKAFSSRAGRTDRSQIYVPLNLIPYCGGNKNLNPRR